MKNLLLVLVLVLALASCGAKSVAGKYRVKVPTGEKVTDVGELDLKSDGTFSMSTGQLKMAGQWTQEGDRVKFSPGDTAAQLLSSKEFKFEGDRLIPQGQAGPPEALVLLARIDRNALILRRELANNLAGHLGLLQEFNKTLEP